MVWLMNSRSFWAIHRNQLESAEKEEEEVMAQAMAEEQKRCLAGQAFDISIVKVQKNKRQMKEEPWED